MDGEAFPRPARVWSGAQIRLTTAGSVDDGKSSLIGRLLLDSKALMRDQAAALGEDDELDLAAVTDGLEAERAQGITIDVAYRYFATPGASFIIADAPGHEQYTRNMVTAASVSDVALIVIDVTGVVGGVLKPQTRRHAAIAALMGLNIVVAVIGLSYAEQMLHAAHNVGAKEDADAAAPSTVTPSFLCCEHRARQAEQRRAARRPVASR